MARIYRRDSRGRFAGGGGASTSARRAIRSKAGASVTADRLKRNAATGTAKPKGTISRRAYSRSIDQFSREMRSMKGAKPGPIVKRVSPTLKQQARSLGVASRGARKAPTVIRDNVFATSAPRGTIPKKDPGAAIPKSMKQRRTASADQSLTRKPKRSKSDAAKAKAAKLTQVPRRGTIGLRPLPNRIRRPL